MFIFGFNNFLLQLYNAVGGGDHLIGISSRANGTDINSAIHTNKVQGDQGSSRSYVKSLELKLLIFNRENMKRKRINSPVNSFIICNTMNLIPLDLIISEITFYLQLLE